MTHPRRFAMYAPGEGGSGGDDMARRQQQATRRAIHRTAAAFQDRMSELGLTVAELNRRSGVSEPVIRDLRDGAEKGYSDRSLSELSKALGWHYRALADMLAGREPETPDATGPVAIVKQARDEMETALEAAIARAREAAELAEEALRRLRET